MDSRYPWAALRCAHGYSLSALQAELQDDGRVRDSQACSRFEHLQADDWVGIRRLSAGSRICRLKACQKVAGGKSAGSGRRPRLGPPNHSDPEWVVQSVRVTCGCALLRPSGVRLLRGTQTQCFHLGLATCRLSEASLPSTIASESNRPDGERFDPPVACLRCVYRQGRRPKPIRVATGESWGGESNMS